MVCREDGIPREEDIGIGRVWCSRLGATFQKSRREKSKSFGIIEAMPIIPDNVVSTYRERFRGLVDDSDALIPDLLKRGRAPTGNFSPMTSLGYVELDRGEEDLRPFVSQVVSCMLEVLTEEEWEVGSFYSSDLLSVTDFLDRLDWCVSSNAAVMQRIPEWSAMNPCDRLECVVQFVGSIIKDYHLRLLEVAETENPVLPELDLPPSDRVPGRLTFFPPYLTVDDHELELTKENASEVRDWLFDAVYGLATRLEEQQINHMIDALHYSDRLCPVSMAKMIP
jgi:hypothetical protein